MFLSIPNANQPTPTNANTPDAMNNRPRWTTQRNETGKPPSLVTL